MQIDDLLNEFAYGKIRYLLMGGQAMRLFGMPRTSINWDFFIPPKDLENLAKLNEMLQKELPHAN